MKRHWLFAVVMVLVTAAALALRLPNLNRRPMHGDEAVHTIKFDRLWKSGEYRYDRFEYHGPTLYYLTLPVVWLSGATSFGETQAATFRLVPALLGAGLILLIWLLRDGWGRAESVCAAMLTAASPAMVFYSRYYIHETLLVFFAFLTIAATWRYVRAPHFGWALAAGLGLGLMQATKETSIIVLGAMAAALALTIAWTRLTGRMLAVRRDARSCAADPDRERESASGAAQTPLSPPSARGEAGPRAGAWGPDYERSILYAQRRCYFQVPAVTGASLAAAVSILLFSGFLRHPQDALQAWLAYPEYFTRAVGHSLHDHPWHYYLSMLAFTRYTSGPVWSEALILLLAGIGFTTALAGNRRANGRSTPLLRFVAIYTLLLTTVYSAMPYKTPWCMLGFLHGMTLLGGVGAMSLIRWLRRTSAKAAVGAGLLLALGQLSWQAYRACFVFCADPRNPYVYAQPVPDVERLAERVEDLSRLHPDGERMLIAVVGQDYWPLPWYLRRLTSVGYWENPREHADAPVVIAAADLQPVLDAKLGSAYVSSYYGLRPDAVLALYVERTLWQKFLEVRAVNRGQ